MHSKKFILAFPGMGKTTLSKENKDYVDFDYGSFRDLMGYSHSDNQAEVIKAYMKVVQHLKGGILLTNEPDLLPHFKQAGLTGEVQLPSDIGIVIDRISDRDQDDGSWDGKFINELTKHGAKWSDDWERKANKYGYKVRYLNTLEQI